MNEINFQPIFSYIDSMRADISGEFTAIHSEIREINVQLANISHRMQIFNDDKLFHDLL